MNTRTTPKRLSHAIVRIAMLYVVFGGLWIFVSDSVLQTLATGPLQHLQWSMYKGWTFVLVTATLLFLLLRRELLALEQSQARERDSEARYRQLFDANPQPLYVYDPETLRLLAVNDAAVAQYGWSRDEFLAMTIADVRPPEEIARLRQHVAELSSKVGSQAAGIWQHRKRDGTLIDVEVALHAIKFDGRPTVLVLAHDVTAQLRAERAVRESERFLRSTLDALPASITILDERGVIVAVNQAWRRFAQQNSASDAAVCEGADYLAICDRAEGQDAGIGRAFSAGIRDVMSGRRKEFGMEYPCHSPAKQRWFSARVTRLAGEDAPHAVVAHVDITERRAAEQTAREQTDRLNHYLSASPCVVYALAGHAEDFVPEWTSQNVQTILGYSVGQALAPGWWLAHVHPDDRAAASAAAKVLLDAGVVTREYRFQHGDGAWIRVNEQLRLLRGTADHAARIVSVWTDVTAVHDAQEALAASERRFRAAFEQVTVGMAYVTAEDGRWLQANQRLCEMFGYTSEELQALKVKDLTHPDDYQHDSTAARQILQGGPASYSREKRYVRKDGRVIWTSVTGTLVRKSDGTPDYFIGVYVDITERKAAEAALRASEENLARAQRIAHLGSWELSLADGRLRCSSEQYRIFGIARTESGASDEAFLTAVHPDDRDRVHAAHQRARAGSETLDIEHRIVRPDASERWVHELGEFERDETGKPVRLTGTVLDITERKRSEAALRMLSLAVEQSSESIVITDLEGRIEYVNEAFTGISGYSSSEVLGQNPRLLKSGKSPPQTYRSMWTALKDGLPWQGEFLNRRKDGSEYLESAIISPLRHTDGRISNYIAVKRDISEKRQIEQELDRYRHHLEELVEERTAQLAQARRQAESANEAKSAFLANMSHEIRTPMNGVLGMADVLAQGRLSEQQAELVRTIRESGMVLLGIIDDILDISKIEAGRLTINQASVSVADLAEGVCDSLLPVAVQKGVDLSVFISPEIPERVRVDDVRLRQMLYNLVGNAIKFSGGRGEKRGRVWLRGGVAAQTPLRLVFAVVDNGIGMSEQTVGTLFTPFVQGEASTTRRFGGTGLGLTITRRLADLMQGEIAVASELGEGSTFTLTLPVEVPADQPARMQPDLHGLHCLLTESAILDMTGVSEYLTHAGARVHRVADAADATRIVAGLPAPVVALCDASQTHHGQPAAFAEAPNVRQLLISRGRRRQARVEVPDIVCLDGTALRRQALLRAVAITAGRASPEIVHESGVEEQSDGAPPMSVAEARDRGQLILVAEDDEVNRRVITTQLELLGRTAEIACDGAEALNMWRDGRYALLLTDLHMPQMDGYALTKAIRLLEAERSRQTPGDRRMPIIALTANALRGEAERAKAVGMDDYLTKPLQLDHLRNVIERYMPVDGSGAATSPSVPQVSVPPEVTLDVAVLRNLVGRRPGKVREFLARYRTAAQRDRIDLHAACNAGNAKEAAAIAHKLKSSSRTVGALRLGELCAEIEQAGHAGDLAAVRQQLACFQTTIDEVSAKIESLLADERT